MIRNVDDFKSKVYKYLGEAWVYANSDEESEFGELQRIVDLIDCDVVYKTDDDCRFWPEIDLNGIINILSDGGKIKKLSEVDFDE